MKKTVFFAVPAVLLLAFLCFFVPDGQVTAAAQNALYTGGTLPSFAWEFRPYGCVLALGALIAWAVAYCVSRQRCRMRDAVLFLCISLFAGVVLSRALYCLVNTSYYHPVWRERSAAFRIMDGGMSMTGAIAGILLAGILVKPARDMIPCAVPLFVCAARLGESFTQLGYGPGVNFDNFFSRRVFFQMRLNVNLIEALTAAAIFIVMLIYTRKDRSGKAAALMLFLYGCLQIFMESLRKDQHMIWGFTKAQQITSILTALGALLYAAENKKQYVRAFVFTLVAAIAFVALEFALDRAHMDDVVLYLIYAAILASYMVFSIRSFFVPARSG